MNIFVSSTATRSSGTLTILKQFLNALPTYINNNKYYIFISDKIEFPKLENVEFITVSTERWYDRIKWDETGISKWVKKTNIKPDLIISLQNTGVKYKNVFQLIYYHQPLPLMDKKWNFFKKKERTYFLYKRFYPFFVKKNIDSNTQFVVQTSFIQKEFIRRYKISSSRVHIIKPDYVLADYNTIQKEELDKEFIHLLYPAAPYIYKNHKLLVSALYKLKIERNGLLSKIKIHFTLNESDDKDLYRDILNKGLSENFIYENTIPHNKLLSLYKSVDTLLFPSYIETLGMPLLEGAAIGLPIIVSDLPYARSVIGEYEGSHFVESNNIEAWSKAIIDTCNNRRRYDPLIIPEESNWKMFFTLIDKMIGKRSNGQ